MDSCRGYYFELIRLAGFFAVTILAFLATIFGIVVIGNLANNNNDNNDNNDKKKD